MPASALYREHILAFDTSGPWCGAALIGDNETVYDTTHENTSRGQAETLLPMLESIIESNDLNWKSLAAIGVGIGPGNFTGIRISVAAARGLSMALGIPAMGVSTFEAMLWQTPGPWGDPALIISLPAPRDMAYVQHFRHGKAQSPPRLIDPASPPMDLEMPMNMTVEGYRAEEIARPFHAAFQECETIDIASNIARMAGAKLAEAPSDPPPPAPLYVRPADAAPPRDAGPVILQP